MTFRPHYRQRWTSQSVVGTHGLICNRRTVVQISIKILLSWLSESLRIDVGIQFQIRLDTSICHPVHSLNNLSSASTLSQLLTRMVKVKWSRYRPGVAQRVGRGIALIFHDRGTRRGWVVSSMPWLHFTPGKDPVPILQKAGWVQGRFGREENLVPTGIRSRTVQP